jgi:hypothetical protein
VKKSRWDVFVDRPEDIFQKPIPGVNRRIHYLGDGSAWGDLDNQLSDEPLSLPELIKAAEELDPMRWKYLRQPEQDEQMLP